MSAGSGRAAALLRPVRRAAVTWARIRPYLGTSPARLIAMTGTSLVSIITPSFNQGQFIEDTIRSIAAQDYPRIEHIVCDGGSFMPTIQTRSS